MDDPQDSIPPEDHDHGRPRMRTPFTQSHRARRFPNAEGGSVAAVSEAGRGGGR